MNDEFIQWLESKLQEANNYAYAAAMTHDYSTASEAIAAADAIIKAIDAEGSMQGLLAQFHKEKK